MSTGAFTLADLDQPKPPAKSKGQFTAADLDTAAAAPTQPRQLMAPGTFQTMPGGPTYNANTLGSRTIQYPTMSAGVSGAKARTQLPGFGQQVQQEFSEGLPQAGATLGAGLGPEGAALGYAAGELSKPLLSGENADLNRAAVGAGSIYAGGRALEWAVPAFLNAIFPSKEQAAALFERAVAPHGMAAEDQAALRDSFDRAAKYIAPETRGPGNQIAKGEGGVMRAADTAGNAADKLWDTYVNPAIKEYAQVQRPGAPVSAAIRSSFTDLEQNTAVGKRAIRAGEQLAQYFDRPLTVQEMSDIVTQLNNDKSVSRYYRMSPMEQTQAQLADPALRGKVAALNALRGQLFDTVGQVGGPDLGAQFQEARKDWGALKTVEQTLREAHVPTPEGLLGRTVDTMRSVWRPEYWGGRQTLFQMENPNRLAPNSFNMLGRTDLTPPTPLTPPPFQPRGLLGPGPLVTPPPPDTSGVIPGPEARAVNQEFERVGLGRPAGISSQQASTIQTAIRGPRYKSLATDEQREYLASLLRKAQLKLPGGQQ